jgi:signal transduction histidine kinase
MKKYICYILFLSIHFAKAQNIDSLNKVLKEFSAKQPSVQRDSNITNTISNIFNIIKIGNIEDQKKLVDSLERFSNSSKWVKTIPRTYLCKGLLMTRKGFFSEGILYFEKAAKLFEKYQDNKNYAVCINNLSASISNEIFFNENIDKVDQSKYKNFLKINLELIKKTQNPLLIGNQETILGLFYLSQKDYKNAYIHYENSEKVTKVDTVKYFYNYYGGIWAKGLCLLYLNKTNEGFKYINIAKKASETPQERGMENYLKAVIGLFLGNFYIEKGDYKSSLQNLKYGEIAKQIANFKYFDKHYAKAYFVAYKNLKEYENALKYHEILQKINTSEEEIRFKEKYTEFQLKYEAEKQSATIKTLENQKLQKENESKDMTRNVLIFSLLAGLGLFSYIYQNNIKLSNKNNQLSTKNKEIEEALYRGQTIERKRIGVELHDNLSAKIGAIRWRLESLEPKFDDIKDNDFYNTTINVLNETYADVRLIAHNLLPEILEEKGLVIATQTLVNELNSFNKTKFSLEILGEERRYPNKIEYELYSILLELSNNILKHANAEKADITIKTSINQLWLVVKDNGIGIDKGNLQFGMGLTNIKSRLGALNGSLDFYSDNGMHVEIKIAV